MKEPKEQMEWADSKKSALFVATTFCVVASVATCTAMLIGYIAAGAP